MLAAGSDADLVVAGVMCTAGKDEPPRSGALVSCGLVPLPLAPGHRTMGSRRVGISIGPGL
jgi:hypothetical protein